MKRREFLKATALSAATLPVIGTMGGIFSACTKGGEGGAATPPAGVNAVDPATNPTAKALGYNADATKVDTAAYPKRAGAEGAKQFCESCSFYTAGATAGWGNCTLLPGGNVNAKGWCNSWTIKA